MTQQYNKENFKLVMTFVKNIFIKRHNFFLEIAI